MLGYIKNSYRRNKLRRRNQASDNYFNQGASQAMESLLIQFPDRRLSSQLEQVIETYAKDVLGSASFATWLKVFTVCRGEFLEGWMPLDYWARIVCPTLNGPLQPLGRVKTLTQNFLNTDALPDMVKFVNGSWLLNSGQQTDQVEAKKILFDKNEYVFLKRDHSSRGEGVIRLTAAEFSRLNLSKLGNFVIQAAISPHDFFKTISPACVPSLRITSYKAPGQKAVVRQSGLRLGLEGSPFIQRDHCLRISIRVKDGVTHDYGFDHNWMLLENHTETGIKLSGLQIPEYSEIKRFCEKLHDQNPHFGLIAWDMMLDENDEIKVLEWNTVTPPYNMDEASIGPHFKGLGLENLWRNKE